MKRIIAQNHPLRVALLIESTHSYGRGLLIGVAKYIRVNGPWNVSFEEHGLCDDVPEWLETWHGDGIIMRIDNKATIKAVRRLNLPTVYVRNLPSGWKVPSIVADNKAIAREAFDHLCGKGFRHFGFCGFNGADYSDERRDAFVKIAIERGFQCHIFESARKPAFLRTVEFEQEGLVDRESVTRWLTALPKPIGVMTCNDIRGMQVLTACRNIGIEVPDEIAVIGVDNDEVLCQLASPPLSSVMPNTERTGFEAAALLDRIIAGHKLPARPISIPPKGVIARHSTETLAIDDQTIAVALRFIREHACNGIGIEDVIRKVGLSRSSFERRFLKAIGRSAKEEILRVRLNCMKELLAETDCSMDFIAERLHIEYPGYASRFFKKRTGLTPLQFRSKFRVPGK